jgi:hypothetical protein
LADFVKFTTGDGEVVLVEATEVTEGPVTRSGRGTAFVKEAGESLDGVLSRLGPTIKGLASELRSAADAPDDIEVAFSVKIAADSNVIIAKAGGEANFQIRLKWTKK